MGNGSYQTFSKLKIIVNSDEVSAIEDLPTANKAFDALAASYDKKEFENPILLWMRKRVWDRCIANFRPGDTILEINCGTGIDAAFLASHGVKVFSTDASEEMIAHARRRLKEQRLEELATVQQLDFHNLTSLRGDLFSGALSNFGGLNCTSNLEMVARGLASLLKPGSIFVACVMPRVALWELIIGVLRADRRLFFRRFPKNGVTTNLRGRLLKVYYHSPGKFAKAFSPHFELVRATGLGLLVPPPYGQRFADRLPRLSKKLLDWETTVAHRFPFSHISDHSILELRRK